MSEFNGGSAVVGAVTVFEPAGIDAARHSCAEKIAPLDRDLAEFPFLDCLVVHAEQVPKFCLGEVCVLACLDESILECPSGTFRCVW